MLHGQPAAHGCEGEGNFATAALSLNLDEQPIIRAPQLGAGLWPDLDEAGFGARGNLGTSTIIRNRPTGCRQAADLSAVIPGI